MTYLPPANGGRINANITGNTVAAGTVISNGTMVLAGGNNVTLSQAGSTITISGPNAAAAASNTFGMSNLGNSIGTSGVISGSALRFAFAGGNNVTLSQSLNASSGTITISAANQSVQTQNMVSVNGSTGAISFSNSNNVTFGNNASTITASASFNQTVQTQSNVQAMYDGANSISTGTIRLSNSNGVSFGINGQTLTASHNGITSQTVQTQSNIQAVYDGANSISTGTIRYSNANGVSFGINGQTLTASHNALTSQTNQTLGLYAVSNTTGESSASTMDARSLSFQGAGIASVGYSGGSVVVSVPSGGGGITNVNLSAGTTSNNLSNMVFSNSNGVSFGLNGSTVTASHNALTSQSVQTQGLQTVVITSNTAGATASISSGAMTLAGGNNITLSQAGNAITISGGAGGGGGGIAAVPDTVASTFSSGTVNFADAGGGLTISASTAGAGQTINFSVPNVSSLSATGAVSISTNGSTISIGVPMFNAGMSNIGNTSGTSGTNTNALVLAGGNNITLSQSTNAGGATITISGAAGGGGGGATLSTWEPWPIHNTGTAILSANTATSGSASFIPFILDSYVAAGFMNMAQSMTFSTGGTSSFNQSATLNYALYSRGAGANSTTLGQVTSGSYSYGVSYNNSSITFSHPTSSATSGYGYGSTTSAGLNVSSGYTGLKLVQLPINSTLSPGVYWLGLFDRASSSSFNSGIRHSYMGNSMTLGGFAPIGSFSSAYTTGTGIVGGQGGNWQLGQGVFTSAGQTNLPTSLALSAMSQGTANVSVIPYIKFVTT